MQTFRPRSIGELVERRIRGAQLGQSQWGQPPKSQDTTSPSIITMSQAVGSAGDEVAERVGYALNVPVHDRDVLKFVAERAQVQDDVIDMLEERARGRLEEYLTQVLTRTSLGRADYLRFITRAVCSFWQSGPCIISGHGSIHLVPRTHALAVRVTAASSVRAAALAEQEHVDLPEARRHLRRIDEEREGYHRRYFDADISDPICVDLTVNTTTLSIDAAADAIAASYRRRFL